LYVTAILSSNRTFHTLLVVGTLVYQIAWMLRLFDTIG